MPEYIQHWNALKNSINAYQSLSASNVKCFDNNNLCQLSIHIYSNEMCNWRENSIQYFDDNMFS